MARRRSRWHAQLATRSAGAGASGRALESLPRSGARYPNVAGCGMAGSVERHTGATLWAVELAGRVTRRRSVCLSVCLCWIPWSGVNGSQGFSLWFSPIHSSWRDAAVPR